MNPPLVVFLHSHRYDRLHQAASILLVASSMGRPCHLFLFHGALESFVAGTWDDVNIAAGTDETAPTPAWAEKLARGFEEANLPSLYIMLEKAAAESGGLTIYACSASCKLLGLDAADVRAKVGEVVGLHTMMRVAQDFQTLYI